MLGKLPFFMCKWPSLIYSVIDKHMVCLPPPSKLLVHLISCYHVRIVHYTNIVYSVEMAEGSAVPAGLEPDQGVGHGQRAQEQHQQQQHQVEVVGAASNITAVENSEV